MSRNSFFMRSLKQKGDRKMSVPQKSLTLLDSFNSVCPVPHAQPFVAAKQMIKAQKENNHRQTGEQREHGGHCVFSALSDIEHTACVTHCRPPHTHTHIYQPYSTYEDPCPDDSTYLTEPYNIQSNYYFSNLAQMWTIPFKLIIR